MGGLGKANRRRDRARIMEASGKIDEILEDVKMRCGLILYNNLETIRRWREVRYESLSRMPR
jgi:hypothetical protein